MEQPHLVGGRVLAVAPDEQLLSEPTRRATAEHYVWGSTVLCDGWHLVRTRELSVIAERMPVGAAEVRHAHRHSRQFFYVLEGELTMEDRGQVHEFLVGQNEGIEINARVSSIRRLNRSDGAVGLPE